MKLSAAQISVVPHFSLNKWEAMVTTEKCLLRWDDFQENTHTAFVALRKDNNFTDVTLACQDGKQVEAHKVILAASSPFFSDLLKRNKHAHPLIYMRGMNSEDLMAIVDFLYFGEASIYQENIETFLNIAQELNLKGMNLEQGSGESEAMVKPVSKQSVEPNNQGRSLNTKQDTIQEEIAKQQKFVCSKSEFGDKDTVVVPVQEISGDMTDLDVQIDTMMEPGGRDKNNLKAHVCKVCGKAGTPTCIKRHIEANHLEGISIPCNLCEKNVRSRHALRQHRSRYHASTN